ncbi:NADH:flavin oxidoreductase [Chloroflexota bacterium]
MSTNLFEPYRIGGLELENRFVRSATWDATADSSGVVTDTSVALYRELARGRIGLIVSGYAFVSPLGQANPGQYSAHTDDMVPGLHRMVQVVHEGGGKIALQIVHAGINSPYLSRKGITLQAVSRIEEISTPHREMTGEEIESLINDYVSAALRGKEAGFDALQLHAAHGYGMSQILSSFYNRRSDQWGGNAENRRRFHLEVVRRIRRAIGADFPFMIKFGVKDDVEGGLSLAEGLETAQRMVEEGVDAIEVSAGAGGALLVMKKGKTEERAPFRRRAAAAKQAVTVPVMVVCGIRSLEMAQSIVDSGDADLISMCRPFIREPGLVARWQRGEKDPATCISCSKCLAVTAKGKPLVCVEERRLRKEAGH